MSIEAQTAGVFLAYFAGSSTWDRIGQRLTISNRKVSDLYFKTYKVGSPSGTITFAIRKVSNDAILASTVWGNAGDVSANTAGVWIGATFNSAVNINEEVRTLMEWSGSIGSTTNYLAFMGASTDVKASEYVTRYYAAGNGYTGYDEATWDTTYYYIYASADTLTVSTQAVSAIGATSATGNGRIDIFGAAGTASQHGHCWGTVTNPSTALATKTTNGSTAVLGAFTSGITGLTFNTLYYVRAYATDADTTAYGVNASFTSGQAISGSAQIAGMLRAVGADLRYTGDDGVERILTGA